MQLWELAKPSLQGFCLILELELHREDSQEIIMAVMWEISRSGWNL